MIITGRTNIIESYFRWMCEQISDRQHPTRNYDKLLSLLYNINFNYTIPLDGNRADDGIDLRYRFGNEANIPEAIIGNCLDDRECSVLEMLVALSIKCEEHIMEDAEVGFIPSRWFWKMISNLGLITQDDYAFDESYVHMVIDRFLYRRYSRNGVGGLFTIQDPSRDMRREEIWYQMMWYLDENM